LPQTDVGPDRASTSQADLIRLQRTIGNSTVQRLLRRLTAPVASIQRANPADQRLPADQAEALTLAQQAKTDIDAALVTLAADPAPERKNTADYVAEQKIVVHALTPRHDSPVGAPAIRFFPGEKDYTESFTAHEETSHHAGTRRQGIWVRARDHANVDAALDAAAVADRVVAAVSEIAFTRAARPGSPKTFELYRARFNGLYVLPTFVNGSDEFDPSFDSKGPRTERSRAVFERIYADEPSIKAAYDSNTGGIREKIDAYTVPDGMNQINSPRLQKLRAAFFKFSVPISNAFYPGFKAAIQAEAAGLDDNDRNAVDVSNDWQKLINVHVKDDAKRAEIRAIINGQQIGPAPAPVPAPAPGAGAPLTRAEFLAGWDPTVTVATGGDIVTVTAGDTVKYVQGALVVRGGAELTGGKPNSGLALFVQARVIRGGAAVDGPKSLLFPPRGTDVSVQLDVRQPAAVPAGGDPLTVRVEILDIDKTTVLSTKDVAFTATVDVPYTKADAIAAATADRAHFLDPSPAGIVGQLNAIGGQHARFAEAMTKGLLKVEPMTIRHDSAAFVAAAGGAGASSVAYFRGLTYNAAPPDQANTIIDEPTTQGMNDDFLVVLVKRTFDVAAGAAGKTPDAEIIEFLVHEGVHAFDSEYWHSPTNKPIERYKTEFRAYWNDGGFGPPDKATCPSPPGDCKVAEVDPTMPAPGPKSPRARAIFEHLYATYDYVQPDYDNNTAGFRDEVDQYVIPDGLNLIVSVRLERLRELIAGFTGANFPAFRAKVQAFTGIGPAPPDGALSLEEMAQIKGNRAWRDLVNKHVPGAANRATIKNDLGIAQ
jgi:hypothetical protein